MAKGCYNRMRSHMAEALIERYRTDQSADEHVMQQVRDGWKFEEWKDGGTMGHDVTEARRSAAEAHHAMLAKLIESEEQFLRG
jgi:hypothetical protein